MKLYVRLTELDVNDFNKKVSERYFQLRKNYLSTHSLINRYISYYDLIKQSGAAQREEEKWSKDTDIDGKELNFDSELNYIIDWFTRHMSYLDKKMSSISNDIKVVLNHQTHYYYNLNGQRIIRKPSNKGLYIKDGKKYIISK